MKLTIAVLMLVLAGCSKPQHKLTAAEQLVLPDILDPMPEVSYVRTFAFDIGVPPADDHVEIVGKNVRCSACHTKDMSDAIWLMKLKLQRGIERAKAVKRGENPQW
jgi:hypothetical protein